jgi:ABC-type sugar transport system permease subunit
MTARLALALLVAALLFLTAYPLGMLVYGSLHTTPPGEPGTFNLDGYRAMLSATNGWVLLNTVGLSMVKTGLAMVLALFMAWIVARTDTPYRDTLEVLITLPFYIPPILTAMAWGMLATPKGGLINLAWAGLTGSREPLVNIYSYGGVVWHMMQYSTPFLFLLLVGAFKSMDPALEESSRMSGASGWTTFRRVTLGLMLPVTTSAFLLSFIRGVESFESALIFGAPAGIEVITTEIYHLIHHVNRPDYPQATALALGIMVLMFGLVAWQWKLLGGRSFFTVTGKGYTPRVMRLGRWRWVTFGFCLLFFVVTVVLPVSQLVIGSFFKFFGFYKASMLTTAHYEAVWDNRLIWRALGNTLLLGHHDAGGGGRLRDRAHPRAGAAAGRGAGVAAVDDAGHGARRRLPVGLRADAGAAAALRHPVGPAGGLRLARDAAGGAHDGRRLLAARPRPGGMLAGARGGVVDDLPAHPARPGVAGLRGRLDPHLLHHPARAVRVDPPLQRRQRGAAGGRDAPVDGGQGGAGERDRARHAGARVPVPLRRAQARAYASRLVLTGGHAP